MDASGRKKKRFSGAADRTQEERGRSSASVARPLLDAVEDVSPQGPRHRRRRRPREVSSPQTAVADVHRDGRRRRRRKATSSQTAVADVLPIAARPKRPAEATSSQTAIADVLPIGARHKRPAEAILVRGRIGKTLVEEDEEEENELVEVEDDGSGGADNERSSGEAAEEEGAIAETEMAEEEQEDQSRAEDAEENRSCGNEGSDSESAALRQKPGPTFQTMNLAVASLVAVPGVDETKVLSLLEFSPAHLLSVITMRREASEASWTEQVLTYAALGWDGNCEVIGRLSQSKKEAAGSASRSLLKMKHVSLLAPQTFLLAMGRVVESIGSPTYIERLSEGFVAGATCYLRRRGDLLDMEEPQTAVAVGVVNMIEPDALFSNKDFGAVCEMIMACSPRFVMGNFGNDPERVKQLAKKFCFRGEQPFVQPWIYNNRLHFYPNYIMPTGPGGQCSYSDTTVAPTIEFYVSSLHETTRSCVLSSLRRWFNLPRWEANEVETFLLPEHFGNLGPCKQKPYADKWHEDGLHTVLVFCGTSRSSHKSIEKRVQQKKTGTYKSKGKGKGKSKDKGKRRKK